MSPFSQQSVYSAVHSLLISSPTRYRMWLCAHITFKLTSKSQKIEQQPCLLLLEKKALCIVPGPQWGPLGVWKDVSIGAIHFFKSEHASLQRVGKTWSSRSLLILMEAWSNCAIINSCLQAWSWSYMRGERPLGECHKVGRHTSCRRLKSGRS